MAQLPTISVTIKALDTDDEFEIPFGAITIDEELNVGRSLRAGLDYRAVRDIAEYYGTSVESILSGGQREIIVKRGTTNIFIGLITDFTLSKSVEDGMRLDIAAVSYFSILSKRRTDDKRVFVGTDAGDIAWTLIDESQQSDLPYSDLGITQGTSPATVSRDITYRFANIKNEITNLSNKVVTNGFDFDIDNSKIFNVFYPLKGMQRPDIVLDEANIMAWSLRKPLIISLTNKVYVVGSGFNDNIIFVTRNASNSYKTAFGLLEEIVSARNLSETANLNDVGDKYLLDNQGPNLIITINHLDGTPDILEYEIGDELKVTIPELSLLENFRRVYRRTIKIDINSTPVVAVELK